MSRNRSSVMFLGFAAMATMACPLAAGCIAAENDEEMVAANAFALATVAPASTGDPEDPPTGPNGDYPKGVDEEETMEALNKLAAYKLVHAVDGLTNEPYIAKFPDVSEEGRKFIRSAVRCALDKWQSVWDPITKEQYKGWWGLARPWVAQPLTETQQRWVSACMIQKLNAYGAPVKILLEGNHPAIEYNPDLASVFPYIEAIAFGNLFLGPDDSEMYISWFDMLATACGDPAAAMAKRVCDTTLGACNVGIFGGQWVSSGPDGRYFAFPAYDYTETIAVRLKTEDISCYGTEEGEGGDLPH
ncbi:MAG TPA: hypothetical protein PK156_14345 [Polyangium sp.]|nr:hypothetical protein [Polyangium sp.]